MELQTSLDHIHPENEFKQIIRKHDKVMICGGRMGPMCVPVCWTREQVEFTLEAHF